MARQIAMKRVVDRVAIEGEYYAALQRTIRSYTTLEHYANHKVNGHNCGLAWKPAIAVTPLATVRNAISEAMNVLYTRDSNVRRFTRCQRFTDDGFERTRL